MKKIIALAVAFTMLMGITSSSANYSDVTNDTNKQVVSLITGLGIMNPNSDGSFGVSDGVTRGDFAVYTVKMLGLTVNQNETCTFGDVAPGTPQASAVNTLVQLGAVDGDPDAKYRPDDLIKYNEAAKIIMCALGYKVIAEQQGGYPTGYLTQATRKDVLKGVASIKLSDAVSKMDIAIMIYNALNTNPLEGSEYLSNGDVNYTEKNVTLLEDRWKIFSYSGIVYGYDDVNLLGSESVRDKCVDISGQIFYIGNTNIVDYVGYSVRAYYKVENDDKTLVAFSLPQNANVVTKIDKGNISNISGNQIQYTADPNLRDKIITVADSYNVLYNNKYSQPLALSELLNFSEGSITLIAHNSELPSVIIIKDEKNGIVERVDNYNQKIYLKDSTIIDLSGTDIKYNITLDGTSLAIGDLVKDDVMTILQSKDNLMYNIQVSRKKVDGKVTSRSADKNEIKIDGQLYKVLPNVINTIAVGDAGTFALTVSGKVAGRTAALANSVQYGYLVKAATSDQTFSSVSTFKIFNSAGEMKQLESTDKVRVNGIKMDGGLVADKLILGNLVTYILDSDGKVREINSAIDATKNYKFIDENSFVKNAHYNAVRYRGGIVGNSLVTDDTVIFYVPLTDRNRDDEYQIYTKDKLVQGQQYKVDLYDINRENKIGAMVIKVDISDSVSYSNNLFIVDDLGTALDAQGNPINTIIGFEAGERKELSISTDATLDSAWTTDTGQVEKFITDLRRGDVLQYSLNNLGELLNYRVVFNSNPLYNGNTLNIIQEKFFEYRSAAMAPQSNNFYDPLYLGLGRVETRNVSNLSFFAQTPAQEAGYKQNGKFVEYCRTIPLDDAYVYLYDTTKNEIAVTDQGTITDDDKLLVRAKNEGELVEILIYR